MPRRDPSQMAEPPWLALCNVEEQLLYSEPLLDDWNPCLSLGRGQPTFGESSFILLISMLSFFWVSTEKLVDKVADLSLCLPLSASHSTRARYTEKSPIWGSNLSLTLTGHSTWHRSVVSDIEVLVLILAASHAAVNCSKVNWRRPPDEPHHMQKPKMRTWSHKIRSFLPLGCTPRNSDSKFCQCPFFFLKKRYTKKSPYGKPKNNTFISHEDCIYEHKDKPNEPK